MEKNFNLLTIGVMQRNETIEIDSGLGFNPWDATVKRLSSTSEERLMEVAKAMTTPSLRNMPIHLVSSDTQDQFKMRIRSNLQEIKEKTGLDIVPLGRVSIHCTHEEENQRHYVCERFDSVERFLKNLVPETKPQEVSEDFRTSTNPSTHAVSELGGRVSFNDVQNASVHSNTVSLSLTRRINAFRWAITEANRLNLVRWFDTALRSLDWSKPATMGKVTLATGGRVLPNRIKAVERKNGYVVILFHGRINGQAVYLLANEAKRLQDLLR